MNFTGICCVKPTLYIPSDETEGDELDQILWSLSAEQYQDDWEMSIWNASHISSAKNLVQERCVAITLLYHKYLL